MDKQWADLILPPAPPDQEIHWLWSLLAILLVVLPTLYYRHRPVPAARRKLRQLRRRLNEHDLDGRAVSFCVAECLRTVWCTPRLETLEFDTQQPLWHEFVRRLQQMQYRPQPPTSAELDDLIQTASKWLDR